MRRDRDDADAPDEDEPPAKRARMEEVTRRLASGEWDDLPLDTWVHEILTYVDSPKELMQLRVLMPRVEAAFARLIWGLYDRHFRSKFTGELALLAQHVRAVVEAETWNEPLRRAMRAYSIMSEAWRATLLLEFSIPNSGLDRANRVMTRRLDDGPPWGVLWTSTFTFGGDIRDLLRARGWRHDLPWDIQPLSDEDATCWFIPSLMSLGQSVWEGRDRSKETVSTIPLVTAMAPHVRVGTMRMATVDVMVDQRRHTEMFLFIEAFDPDAYWRAKPPTQSGIAWTWQDVISHHSEFVPMHPVFDYILNTYGSEQARSKDYVYYGATTPALSH